MALGSAARRDLLPVPWPASQDICNRRRHRLRRKAELLKLQATLQGLHAKATFYEEQGDYYSQYIRACLGHLAPSCRWARPCPRCLCPSPHVAPSYSGLELACSPFSVSLCHKSPSGPVPSPAATHLTGPLVQEFVE